MHLLFLAFSLLPLLFLVHSIEVTPNSKCSSLCASDISMYGNIADGGSSWTFGSDVVCEDYKLAGPNSTLNGRKWNDCLTCELSSTAVDLPSNESEIYWVLFNLKISFAWCVFAYPDNENLTAAGIACAQTCQGLNNNGEAALVDRLRQFDNATLQYQYCETGNGAFPKVVENCIKCLEKVPNSKVLINYVKALNTACTQKPAPGETLKLDFDLFSFTSTPATTKSGAVVTIATISEAVVTISTNPVYPSPSAFSGNSAPAAAVATAQAKANSNKSLRLGLGVSLTTAVVVAILAILGFIYGRRRAKRIRMIVGEQARAQLEADDHARQQGQQQQHYSPNLGRTPEELDALYNGNCLAPEADDGRPRPSPAELPSAHVELHAGMTKP